MEVKDNNLGTSGDICFGLDRASDERSLALFMKRVTDDELLSTLIARMSDAELLATLDFLTGLMKRHLSDTEYHGLFLA